MSGADTRSDTELRSAFSSTTQHCPFHRTTPDSVPSIWWLLQMNDTCGASAPSAHGAPGLPPVPHRVSFQTYAQSKPQQQDAAERRSSLRPIFTRRRPIFTS